MQGGGLKLEASPYEEDLTSHPRHIPDTANLAEQFQACLQVQLNFQAMRNFVDTKRAKQSTTMVE